MNDQRQWSSLNVGDADLECACEYNLILGFRILINRIPDPQRKPNPDSNPKN